MKAKMEIDLTEAFVGYGNDGEEHTADFSDVIVSSVVESVIRRNNSYITKTVNEKIAEAIGSLVENILDEKINAMLDDFLNEEVTISDGFKKKTYSSLLDYVEERMKAVYREKMGNASCEKDVLVERLNSTVRKEVKRNMESALLTVEREGKRIAQEEMKRNSTLEAIKTILKTENEKK